MVTNYEGFYEGGASSLSPDYGNFAGYRLSGAQLGFPGSPQTANQLGDVVSALKHGTKVFEVTMLQPDVGETIPKQHFEEMRALMKLSGVKPSMHGPLIDAAGFGEKGWGGDNGRADNERRMFDSIEKAHMLDPKGNIPVVFHSSNGTPGAEWRPGNEKLGEDKFVMEAGTIINRDTGQVQGVKREYKIRPSQYKLLEKGGIATNDGGEILDGHPAGVLFDAEESVRSANASSWDGRLTEMAQMSKHASEIIGSNPLKLEKYKDAVIAVDGSGVKDLRTGEKLPMFEKESIQENSYNQMRKAGLFLESAELSFGSTFEQAYKYGTPEQKKELKDLAKIYSKKKKEVAEIVAMDNSGKKVGLNIWSPIKRQMLLDETLNELQRITQYDKPEVFKLTEKFAMDKAAETFGNLAKKSYDKFGGSAPVLAIENMHPGMAFLLAKDMKKLIEKSRKNFAKQLVEDKGFNKKEAAKVAEKHLGVTWDVGHVNMLRKTGFTEKDIVEQTKEINKDKSMVKHIHLTDNFGYADTHLLPGMGNVPIKGIMEELEKNGRFGEMRKIVEAGGLVQHFKKLPHGMALAAFGSPIYGMKSAPYWNQAADIQGNYSGGYGTINPQTHHSYFGSGFTTMPVELGGQMPGGGSRFGGTPMA